MVTDRAQPAGGTGEGAGGGEGGGGRPREVGGGAFNQHAVVVSLKSVRETLYHRDDALIYIAYVMLIWAAPIPADRWRCSLWP